MNKQVALMILMMVGMIAHTSFAMNPDTDALGRDLITAIGQGRRDDALDLIKRGANVNLDDSILIQAVRCKGRYRVWIEKKPNDICIELVRKLIHAGAKVDNLLTLIADGHESVNVAHWVEVIVDEMLKPTQKQKQAVVIFIGSMKKGYAREWLSKDTITLAAQELFAVMKRENKEKTRKEINKIKNDEIRQRLLNYVNKRDSQ